jgi:hypothetical protein
MALFNQPTMFSPNLDPATETVEGRIGNILKTDDRGNYTNQVVRQAQDRQEQAFNARGLRNSSIAVQGGTEAAISKAVDIAAPDAKMAYDNRRGNLEMGQSDRGNYQQAMQAISTNYQRQLDTINASSMTPEDKSVAIAQAGSVRDGELAFHNNLYGRMPGWQQDWLAPAVNTAGMDMGAVGNQDTLANVSSDPGQAQETRDAATQRLQAIRGGASTMVGGAPSPDGPSTPQNGFPPVVGGQRVNWDEQPSSWGRTQPSLRASYNQYRAQGGTLPPEQWYLNVRLPSQQYSPESGGD